MKQKINLEFTLNTSPAVLYKRLSTPSGLSEWFADDVNLHGNVYTFIWDGAQEQAEMIGNKENIFVRYRWLEAEGEENYFEFRISKHELTGDVALEIIDFAEEEDAADSEELWNSQVSKLKHVMGL